MQSILFLSLLFFIVNFPLLAQVQNQSGTITLSDNNKLDGEITFSFDEPNKINLNQNGEIRRFKPHEIILIETANGKRFVSKKLPQLDSAVHIFQALVESNKISLYETVISGKPELYITKNSQLYHLKNTEAASKEGNVRYRKMNNEYVSTLNILMQDDPDALSKIKNLKLHKDLIKDIVLFYNKGDISYLIQDKKNVRKEPNWVFYSQYSHYTTYVRQQEIHDGNGFSLGLQYYLSKDSRSSFRIGFEHLNYKKTSYTYSPISNILVSEKIDTTSSIAIQTFYINELVKKERYSFYLLINILNISYKYSHTSPNDVKVNPMIRISPGFGFDTKIMSKLSLYGELNNLLHLRVNNFSFGLRYDLGKTTW